MILTVYSNGGHGFVLEQQGTSSDRWIEQLHVWMGAQGFLERRN
jgi:hypothetical protein